MADLKPQIPKPESRVSGFAARQTSCDLLYAILVACGFLLRLASFGRYVTPDEPAWVYRTIRFADALSSGQWSAVPSTGHPGVTTMWLGAAGMAIQQLLNGSSSAAHLGFIRQMAWLSPEYGEPFRHLAFFLPSGRVTVALATTLGLAVLYPLLARLLDRRVALLAVGLLALDPFLIGHSGLLHTDALLATFILLALVTTLIGLQEPHRLAWPALSGLFAGLAVLTKAPALILIPFVFLMIGIATVYGAIRCRTSLTRCVLTSVVHLFLFTAITALSILALYPALWANTPETLQTFLAFTGRHIAMAQRPIFFAGQMTYDPGWPFYPAVFLFRVTPAVLIGLIAGAAAVPQLPSNRRLTLLLLLAFSLGFGIMMSLGTKKHDRYLLPAIPPLAVASAISIDWYVGRSGKRYVGFSALTLQALVAMAFLLHPLTYFNPLVGGPWVAVRVLPTDWGEGAGAAARWLNQLSGAEHLAVAASSVPSFASLFEGRTLTTSQTSQADYLVLGPNQPTDQPFFRPTHAVTLGLFAHATVYSNTAPPALAAHLSTHAAQTDLILFDADTPLLRRYTGPTTAVSTIDSPDQDAVSDRLAELSTVRAALWLVADPAASPITALHLRQAMQAFAAPVSTTTIGSTTITRYELRDTPRPTRQARHANFGHQIVLLDAVLPNTPVNAAFPISLRWQTPAPTPTDLQVSLQLRDSERHLWSEVGQLIHSEVTFPTSAWAPGEWNDMTVTLEPPERIPPSVYDVELIVIDPTGAQQGAWDARDQFQGVRVPLGNVEISPPVQPAGPPPCNDGRMTAAGPLMVCIPELPPRAIPSGDVTTLALTWSSIAPPESDYQIRWRLRLGDTPSVVALEQTRELGPYPTSRWRKGDSFETQHDLRLEPALPAGQYLLSFNLLTSTGRSLWTEDQHLTSVDVLFRDRSFDLPADIAYPLDLTMGQVVHLLGFDMPQVEAAPQTTLPLTLYWQADGSTEVDYTVFVHLVGPDGRPHGQVDRFPAGGRAPTTSWVTGQVIVDEIALPVDGDAPPGNYRVVVGMYDAVSGGRLVITDADGQSPPDDQATLPLEIIVSGAGP